MKQFAVAFLLAVLCAAPLFAQHHNATSAKVVDGAKNPELIPDTTAYLHVFLNLSVPSNFTEADKRAQLSHLTPMKLEPRDFQSALTVLAEFRSQHDAWLGQWNEAATKLGNKFSPVPFQNREVEIVQTTRDALKRDLSAFGMLQFDNFVQSFKKSITIHTGGVQ